MEPHISDLYLAITFCEPDNILDNLITDKTVNYKLSPLFLAMELARSPEIISKIINKYIPDNQQISPFIRASDKYLYFTRTDINKQLEIYFKIIFKYLPENILYFLEMGSINLNSNQFDSEYISEYLKSEYENLEPRTKNQLTNLINNYEIMTSYKISYLLFELIRSCDLLFPKLFLNYICSIKTEPKFYKYFDILIYNPNI